MSALLASVGEQPTAISPLIDHLLTENLREVVLLVTKDPYVLLSARVIQWEYHQIPVSLKALQFEDAITEDDLVEVMRVAREELIRLRRWRRVYVGISGGRKGIAATLALAGSFFGAYRVLHVITEEISSVSPEWYSIREELRQDFEKFVGQRGDEIREFLHRPGGRIVALPLIPAEINEAVSALEGMEKGHKKARPYLIKKLEEIGALRKGKLTEYGKMLVKALGR
ncbi:MAG: CRISPR-associated ring nuclease [Candidatus Hadarchaeum sp.]|uniref:CRISPR-associated ring nuclease n=1 Tax=Candidatus Hadarchaeum sp. TaxID=2883567 RepID=UPI003D13599F